MSANWIINVAGLNAYVALRHHAVKAPHQCRQIGLLSMQHQVVVIIHQAISHYRRLKSIQSLRQNSQKPLPIFIVNENGFLPITTCGHMVNRVREFNA